MPAFHASTVAEIHDYLGAMVLCMPDDPMPVSKMGMEETYFELFASLEIIRSKIGEAKYNKLIDMAAESKKLYEFGDDKAGCFMLQDMQKVLLKGLKAGLHDYH